MAETQRSPSFFHDDSEKVSLVESQETQKLESQDEAVPESQDEAVPETQKKLEFDAQEHCFEELQKEYRFQDPEVQELLDIINSNGCDKWLDPAVTRILTSVDRVEDILIRGDQTFDNWSVKFPVKDGELLKDVLVKAAQLQMNRYKPMPFDHLGLFQLEMLVRNVLQMARVIVSADWKEPLDELERKIRGAGHEFCEARNKMEDKMRQDVANRKRKREEACEA